MPKVADVIAERYELVAHLGDGGAASVWKARDRTLEREVAIKFLYAADERDAEALRKQFLREARIACAVKHRNVIQTMDFGQTDEGRAYMVMELLHGQELSQRIDVEPNLTLEEGVQIVASVLRGLQAIHEAGIVHRDLKPENIYLERDQEGVFPKILDFGIAKSIDRRGSRRSVLTTKEGVVVGTPEYMSPEQARGVRDLDPRADVWSVGVILFVLFTGELPFDDPSEAEIIVKLITTQARAVTELAPQVPKPLSDLVAKALDRDRDKRFQTAAEMQQALLEASKSLADGESPHARVAAERRRRTTLLLSGVGAIALLVFIALLVRQQTARSAGETALRQPPKAKTVTVELHGVPSSAGVLVNGKPVLGTKLTLPNDGYSRLIEVQAPDRAPWRVMHPAGNNADYQVRMPLLQPPEPVAEPAAPAPATPSSAAESVRPAEEHAAAPSVTSRSAAIAPRIPRSATRVVGATKIAGVPAEHPPGQDPQTPALQPAKKAPAVWRSLDF
jgi:serine/threonine-protein kinase